MIKPALQKPTRRTPKACDLTLESTIFDDPEHAPLQFLP